MSSANASTSTKKPKEKGKKKEQTGQTSSVVTPHGRNEGSNTDWEYKPPPGAVLVDHSVDAGEFDYDSLKGQEDHLEMWIIRVPDAVKPKYLQNVSIDVPSGSTTAKVGSLERKHASYDTWCLGEDTNDNVGGEEVKNLSVLVPRARKGGKLYAAPKLPTRHFVFSGRPALPTPEPSSESPSDSSPTSTFRNPPRPTYPKGVLKHRFMPYGSLSSAAGTEEQMDVDDVKMPPSNQAAQKPSKSKSASEEGGKAKKRKVEADDDPEKKSRKSKRAPR
ncbi:unnamed protein product [Somion occarium]